MCTAHSQASLQPNAVINQLKAEGKSFSAYQPFLPTTQARSAIMANFCKDCAVMTLDKTSLQRMSIQQAEQLSLQLPGKSEQKIELELYQVDLFASGFQIETSDGQVLDLQEDQGLHYRGIIKGENQSIAAVSIYEDEIMMLMSSPERGNIVVGQLEDQSGDYVMYTEETLEHRHSFDCATEDTHHHYHPEELAPQAELRNSSTPCVKIYLEIDNDVYNDKGGTDPTVNFIAGIFNEVATLYANEDVKVQLSKLFLWTGQSPYSASNSFDMLRQFQSTRTSFDGDLAQLISYQASGGIAIVDGLCQSRPEYRMSFSSISRSYRTVPTYSYTVMVVAHELGHLLGSQHTHACVWNGNGTALDGCAGFVEGNCALPTLPSGGGTIMSYCHITNTGINFAKGFGPQPGNLIRNRVAGASCLQVCSTNDGGDDGNDGDNGNDGGDCVDVTFNLVLDLFGTETSWEIRDTQGNLVGSGGGYKNKKEGETISETFCLTEGCYTLKVSDTEGDGLCCKYGEGSFQVSDDQGTVLASGAQFNFETVKEFCIDGQDDDDDNNDNDACVSVDFNEDPIIKYGGSQDQGRATLIEGGKGAVLTGNAWKAINLPYEVTSETVLRFEFRSTKRPEIAGIGFDEDNSLSSSRTFILYGSQNWGIRNFKNYSGNGQWKTYEIPVGSFYTGQMEYLFFAADHDRSPKDGDAQFRNIFIYEATPCSNIPSVLPTGIGYTPAEKSINVFPNPGNKAVYFEVNDQLLEVGSIEVYNMYGQQVKSARIEEAGVIKIKTNDLPNGTYLYRLSGFESEYIGKFSVHR